MFYLLMLRTFVFLDEWLTYLLLCYVLHKAVVRYDRTGVRLNVYTKIFCVAVIFAVTFNLAGYLAYWAQQDKYEQRNTEYQEHVERAELPHVPKLPYQHGGLCSPSKRVILSPVRQSLRYDTRPLSRHM